MAAPGNAGELTGACEAICGAAGKFCVGDACGASKGGLKVFRAGGMGGSSVEPAV